MVLQKPDINSCLLETAEKNGNSCYAHGTCQKMDHFHLKSFFKQKQILQNYYFLPKPIVLKFR
jgi:hypothetical protein